MEFSVERSFPHPPDRVFAALTDLARGAEWRPGFLGIERLTEGDFGVGTEWRETRKVFGRTALDPYPLIRSLRGASR